MQGILGTKFKRKSIYLKLYSCKYFSVFLFKIAETYAFLPREAVTKFLMSCADCQKRMHLTMDNYGVVHTKVCTQICFKNFSLTC